MQLPFIRPYFAFVLVKYVRPLHFPQLCSLLHLKIVPLEGALIGRLVLRCHMSIQWLRRRCIRIERQHIACEAAPLHVAVHLGGLANLTIDSISATIELCGQVRDLTRVCLLVMVAECHIRRLKLVHQRCRVRVDALVLGLPVSLVDIRLLLGRVRQGDLNALVLRLVFLCVCVLTNVGLTDELATV